MLICSFIWESSSMLWPGMHHLKFRFGGVRCIQYTGNGNGKILPELWQMKLFSNKINQWKRDHLKSVLNKGPRKILLTLLKICWGSDCFSLQVASRPPGRSLYILPKYPEEGPCPLSLNEFRVMFAVKEPEGMGQCHGMRDKEQLAYCQCCKRDGFPASQCSTAATHAHQLCSIHLGSPILPPRTWQDKGTNTNLTPMLLVMLWAIKSFVSDLSLCVFCQNLWTEFSVLSISR